MLNFKVLSFREISERLDANSCRSEWCQKDMLCAQKPELRGFVSGGDPAPPWPSEAAYPKSLLHLEDGLEPSGGQKERPPSLSVHPLASTRMRPQRMDCFFLGPFSLALLLFSPMLGVILLKYLVLPNLVINLMLQEKNN